MSQIEDIEHNIDQVWDNLAIYKMPLHLALFTVLSNYEYLNADMRVREVSGKLDRRDAEGGIVHLRSGLQALMPQLYKKCPSVSFKQKHIQTLRDLRTSLLPAIEASNFSQRYEWFAYHITSYRRGWQTCSAKERILTFSYPENVNIGNSLMHHALKRLHEEYHTDKDQLSRAFSGMSQEELTKNMRLSLRHKGIEQYIYSIPSDVLRNVREKVGASSPEPTIHEELIFETYSIGDYYRFSKILSALMICYLQACKIKYRQGDKRLLFSRVLVLTLDEIVKMVSSSGEVTTDACRDIVRDFTFDTDAPRPDIQIRYIVPIKDSDYVYLSPTLVFTSSWEVCLFRNWAGISPEKYGDVIASKKDRLANRLAKHFTDEKVVKAIRRNILSSRKDLVGDIDLAVFDRNSGYLAIIELKWIITPDSFQEESHAREEVSKGIDQLELIIRHYEKNDDLILKQLFGNQGIESKMVTEVQYFLICDGHIYHYDKAEHLDINVLDYQLCAHTLEENSAIPTKERFNEVINRNLSYAQTSADDLCYHTMKIAGYAFRTPGERGSGRQGVEDPIDLKSYHPKSKCYCGSGRLYKDCCQLVESIEEKPTDYT